MPRDIETTSGISCNQKQDREDFQKKGNVKSIARYKKIK